jgi:pyrroline-5-carboxylate reductase
MWEPPGCERALLPLAATPVQAMKLTFIGGGNMASALIGGLLRKGWHADDMRVVEVDPAQRARLAEAFGVQAFADPSSGAAGAECIVLAVKPQQLAEAARALRAHLGDALVITIAAGVRVTDLSRWLGGYRRIVRAMPNTPALVLSGMTGLYAPAEVSAELRGKADAILSAAGATLWVEDESRMDAVTAVSGSGPGYVFYFVEALERAAAGLGFDETAARRLALQTFAGAVKLALESSEPPSILRARVTSRGGTTERALEELERDGVAAAIVRAVRAAAARSQELGDALGGSSADAGDGA